ncbi:MAG: copper amine oxidase N-terminal domain-containing protein [Oscillospiraceae bacterium]|nr:copper amine oxidase N-terminal domain-containing protein [Oscillospiraceae bacterium]
MIKTVGLVLLALVMLVAFTACGAQEDEYNNGNEGNGYENGEENLGGEMDWDRYPIIVNGVGITDETQMIGEDAIWPTHVPLVAVMEALEKSVEVDGDEVTVEGLNGEITFTVGSTDFEVDGERIVLPQSSVEVDGTIYVPLRFFRDVFGGSAYFSGGNVFVNTAADEMH